MVLQDIINNYVWTPYGIECPDNATMRYAHRFLREAILDRHIYVCKVVGFEIKVASMSRAHVGTYIARHKQIAESYPEIMRNMRDKVFLTQSSKDLSCVIKTGMNTMENTEIRDTDAQVVQALYRDPELCRVIEKECVLSLKVVYDCGYRYCQQNSKKIGSDYFPCDSDFYIGDFFRVLPPDGGNRINIRYYYGAGQGELKLILTQYLAAIMRGSLRKEEREWLRNFMQ